MKFLAFALFANLFLCINADGQNTYDSDSIANTFKTFIQNNEQERIILQTNRSLYIAGEKIWLKAFVISTATHKISHAENNLFADLVNDNDSVIAKVVLDNKSLNTSATFALPDSLQTGFYWLRAYTMGMLAENTEHIFIQPVYILNKALHDATSYNRQYTTSINKKRNVSAVITFYPERLTGISNVLSAGVLQITDANNNPLTAAGNIVNNNDSVITPFTTNHLGLARITFLYNSGLKYYAVFHINGRDIKYLLPAIDHSKVQLSVTNQQQKSIKAFVTTEDSIKAGFHTTILGINGDSLCFAAVGSGTYGITIPLDNFPGGINSLLLLDDKQHLLAERKIFIDKTVYELSVKANKKNYNERENAILDIKIKDINGKPIKSSLNIAVEDAWFAQLSDSIEMNELPPSNEFELNKFLTQYHDQFSAADIDLLMVASKSAYNLSKNHQNQHNTKDTDDASKLLNVMGRITDKKNNPRKDRIVTAVSKNQNIFFADIDTTKQDGTFKIPLPQNIDSLMLSLQVTDKHRVIINDDKIIIDSFNYPRFKTPVALKEQFLAYNLTAIASIKKYQIDTAITFQGRGWLKPITVKTIKKEELNYDESKRINSISQILTSDKFRYGGYNAISNAVLMVPGVSFAFGDLVIFGPNINLNGHVTRPLIIMDGYEVPSENVFETLNSLNAADIDFIEVLRGAEAGFYGLRGGGGVISINTKHGNDKIDYSKTNFKTFMPLTYHYSSPFPMPDYANPAVKNNKLPDPRTAIYWNGNLITNTKGEASVNFYTADNAGSYSVTITGITAKGYLVYKRIFISRN